MKTFAVLTIVQLFSLFSYAFVLPLESILNKNVALAGNSVIQVEQNVIFRDGTHDMRVHESWLIEGDRNLKLVATGQGELRDLVHLNWLYNNNTRTQVVGKVRSSSNVPLDFFERFLAIKSRDSYLSYLSSLGIAQKVRYSRAGGFVCFAVGEASTESRLSPQLWFEQNDFHLVKIRFPSEAEVEFSDYDVFGKVHYPLVKKIEWAGKSVTIQVLSVNTKTSHSIRDFYPENLDTPSDMQLANKGPLGELVEEFYRKFR